MYNPSQFCKGDNICDRKTLTSGFGLDDMALAWPSVVQLVYKYSGPRHTIELAMSTRVLFIIVINSIFMFSL